MEIFPGGSGLSPSKEVNKGEIIIIIIIIIMRGIALAVEIALHPGRRNVF